MTRPYLEVDDLCVTFPTDDGDVHAVDGVSFSVERGRTLAIVGESGSGKSVTSQAIMGLVNRKAASVSGRVVLDGDELVAASEEQVRALRGNKMAMIFQDPLSSLHPFYTISHQMVEAIRVHQDVEKDAAREQSQKMLERVGIPNASRRIDDYPHQLSGGMRQRVMIAMALVNSPDMLIADEPTTALDVTVQAQILDLLNDLQKDFGTAILLITHDLGVVAEVADEVVVMYGGRIVEHALVDDLYYRPQMPYTMGLLASIPRMDQLDGGRLVPIAGQPPSLINLPSGCVFRPRCDYSSLVPNNRCATEHPALLPIGPSEPNHEARCHLTPEQRREIVAERLGIETGGAA